MDVYEAIAEHLIMFYETIRKHMATVAAKNCKDLMYNEKAQLRKRFQIINGIEARTNSWLLPLPMCTLTSDSSTAIVICASNHLNKFDKSQALKVRAYVTGQGNSRNQNDKKKYFCRLTAKKAYKTAEIGPRGISIAEIHNVSTVAEIIQTENFNL